MKINMVLVTFGLVAFCCDARGQDSLSYNRNPFIVRDLPSKFSYDPPFYIIKSDGKTCNVPSSGQFSNTRKVRRAFKRFDADLVECIDVLKGKDAADKYGTFGQFGVLVINMKSGTYDSLPRKLKRGCK